MWAFYPFERLAFKNVLKILLINIWIFIPLLIYMWGVEGVTTKAGERAILPFYPKCHLHLVHQLVTNATHQPPTSSNQHSRSCCCTTTTTTTCCLTSPQSISNIPHTIHKHKLPLWVYLYQSALNHFLQPQAILNLFHHYHPPNHHQSHLLHHPLKDNNDVFHHFFGSLNPSVFLTNDKRGRRLRNFDIIRAIHFT